MKLFCFLVISCVVASIGWLWFELAKLPPPKSVSGYDVKFLVMIEGDDGIAAMVREYHMPLIPKVGDTIDMYQVVDVNYSTNIKSYFVSFATIKHKSNARETAKILTPASQGWKEQNWHPKKP